MHAGVSGGGARGVHGCHVYDAHNWWYWARVAVEARRGDGAGLRSQGRNPGSDLRPEVASDLLLPSAINVTAHGIS